MSHKISYKIAQQVWVHFFKQPISQKKQYHATMYAHLFTIQFDDFSVLIFFVFVKPPTGKTNLKEDNDGTDEHADALEKISYHMDEGCSHTGIGLLSPAS